MMEEENAILMGELKFLSRRCWSGNEATPTRFLVGMCDDISQEWEKHESGFRFSLQLHQEFVFRVPHDHQNLKYRPSRLRGAVPIKRSAMAAVGDVIDTINLIKGIIDAIETAHKLKDVCLEFKEYLWCISKNLEQLQRIPLSDTTAETLRKVNIVLAKADRVIKSSQNRNWVYLTFNGARIQKQIKEAHSMVVSYMVLIPVMQFFETFKLFLETKNIILQEPHESASNGTDAVSNPGCLTAPGVCSSLRIFAFKELRSATDDFKHDHLIGMGLFGYVYKGLVKDDRRPGTLVVAIKRFHGNFDGQPSQEAETELKYLERISHSNVIKLLGYCNKIDKRKLMGFHRKEANIYLSVFEYMANGSLSNHLFSGRQAFELLSWAQRIKIATDSARALAFLHKFHIIHRDVKSANILLDSNFNSKLASFGSATDFNSHTEINIIYGTPGYIAPEYICYAKLSEKVDVYGFGVTLLEILSGQHASYLCLKSQQLFPESILPTSSIIQQSLEDSRTYQYIDHSLQKFIISSTSGLKNLDNLVDPRLDGKYPLEAAHLAVQFTVSCVAHDPNERPSMEEAIKVLEQIQTIKMPSTASAPGQIISDPCDPLPCDIDFMVSRPMVYGPAPFDADAELSFSVPRSI